MSKTELVTGQAVVWPRITRQAKQSKRRQAAVAYAGKDAPGLLPLNLGDRLYVDASDHSLAQGQTHPDALSSYFKTGVIVRSLKGLHAKVYLFGGTAIIGSANASKHSGGLLEAVCITTDRDAVASVRRFFGALEQRDDLEEVDDAFLKMARVKYRPPKTTPPKAGHSLLPEGNFSLVITFLDWQDLSAGAVRLISKTRRSVRRATGPAARYRIGLIEVERRDRDLYRRNDVLLQVCADHDGNEMVSPPATVVEAVDIGDRRQGQVVFVREDQALQPVPYDALRAAVPTLPTGTGPVRRIRKPELVAGALAIWGLR